jgi:hypothetical protein
MIAPNKRQRPGLGISAGAQSRGTAALERRSMTANQPSACYFISSICRARLIERFKRR